jgi:hypothetical protein
VSREDLHWGTIWTGTPEMLEREQIVALKVLQEALEA